MWILVTGGLGYIGSHVAVELCLSGFNIVVLDCVINTTTKCGMQKIIREHMGPVGELIFRTFDLTKESIELDIECDVIAHFAGLKSVADSVNYPLDYYNVNLKCLFTVLKWAGQLSRKPSFIFSSSATVYGEPESLPITEKQLLHATNPYGQSKIMCEQILRSMADSQKNSPIHHTTVLRFFNPVGAHPSGHIGECSQSAMNLIPILCEVLSGQREHVKIFGRLLQTFDGTAIRDYIHVMDIADAYVAVLQRFNKQKEAEYLELNLSRGKGISVLEMIREMEHASGIRIKTHDASTRPGDVAENYGCCAKAESILGWSAKRSVYDMCNDSWNFYKKMLSETC